MQRAVRHAAGGVMWMSDGWRATRGAIHARAVAGGRCCSTWAGGVRARVAGSEKGVFLDVGACGAHGREEWVAVGSRKDGFGQLAGSSDRWAVGAVCVAQRSARIGGQHNAWAGTAGGWSVVPKSTPTTYSSLWTQIRRSTAPLQPKL